MSKVILVAPLSGWAAPLDELPDAVFAGRMLGDGLAIDPTGATLHAPCDGELIAVAATKHAVTLRTEQGAEILLHVGIDTVGLGGEGFDVHVSQGQRVRAGERLLSFDMDLLARRATSLLTPIVVLEGSGFAVARRALDREVGVGEVLMELTPAEEVALVAPGVGDRLAASRSLSRAVVVALEHGIHARPAALLAGAVKGLSAEVAIAARGRKANARSTVALMTLGVKNGDSVEVTATGRDAAAGLAAIEHFLRGEGVGAEAVVVVAPAAIASKPAANPFVPAEPASPSTNPSATALTSRASNTLRREVREGGSASTTLRADRGEVASGTLRGVIASRGLSVGRTFQLTRREITVREQGEGVEHERHQLERARATVKQRLTALAGAGAEATKEIIGAHLELLDDPELIEGANANIATGKSAGYAWRQAIRGTADALKALNDPRMAERVDDLLDIEAQVVEALTSLADRASDRQAPHQLPPNTILLSNDLLPSQLVALDSTRLAGICLAAGGATSHVAILAAATGVPMLVAMGPDLLSIKDTTSVILDAEQGVLQVSPDADTFKQAEAELTKRSERRAAEQAAAQRECYTADGTRIEVFANIGSAAEAEAAIRNGAEGCGLLRTEFLFLERQSPPHEKEQATQYQRIATALSGKPLTLRTLDIGGDKPIPYLPLPHEDNPALGLRGVRTSLWRPDLLRIQLRAVLAIQPHDQARILLPMITDAAEIRTVRNMLDEERAAIGRSAPIELGVMIETPAAAVMADKIAAEADFLSIGTNDLTQYTLAMDRGHPELAARLDGLHPAVLRLIARAASAALERGRGVAICGGLASDPTAAPILIGLGVHELSMVPSVIPQLKALISELSLALCRDLAKQAMELETAEEVRALVLKTVARRADSVVP
jgi:multiphosphoryl transfer protein